MSRTTFGPSAAVALLVALVTAIPGIVAPSPASAYSLYGCSHIGTSIRVKNTTWGR